MSRVCPDLADCSSCPDMHLPETQKEEAVAALVKLKVVGRIMDYLREDNNENVGLLVMLLANVTTSDSGCLRLLQLDSTSLAGFNVYAPCIGSAFQTTCIASSSEADSRCTPQINGTWVYYREGKMHGAGRCC